MSILSAALTAKLADFAVRFAIRLAIKFNDGPAHNLAEKLRIEIAESEAKELSRRPVAAQSAEKESVPVASRPDAGAVDSINKEKEGAK